MSEKMKVAWIGVIGTIVVALVTNLMPQSNEKRSGESKCQNLQGISLTNNATGNNINQTGVDCR